MFMFCSTIEYFIFQVLFENTKLRDKAIKILQESNIGFSIHYATPVPLFSFYKKKYGYKKEQFPNSFNYYRNSISLPINNNIQLIQKHIIVNILKFWNFLIFSKIKVPFINI